MKYEKSAASSGLSCVAWAVGIVLVMGGIQIFGFGPHDVSVTFWLIGLMIAGGCGWLGVAMIRKGGYWDITIDRDGVTWSSPFESVDPSFQIAMEDLDRVETRISPSAGKGSTVRYVLVRHCGKEQKLSKGSGINLKHVIAELERLGVKHDVVNTRKRRRAEAKADAARRRAEKITANEAVASHR